MPPLQRQPSSRKDVTGQHHRCPVWLWCLKHRGQFLVYLAVSHAFPPQGHLFFFCRFSGSSPEGVHVTWRFRLFPQRAKAPRAGSGRARWRRWGPGAAGSEPGASPSRARAAQAQSVLAAPRGNAMALAHGPLFVVSRCKLESPPLHGNQQSLGLGPFRCITEAGLWDHSGFIQPLL